MITLVLSLMITYAIAQVLISANQSSVTSDGMSQAQETGRFVMANLAGNIREAGLNSTIDLSKKTPAFISCATNPGLNPTECIQDAGGGEDQITITGPGIHGDRLAVAWYPPAGREFDCTGSSTYFPSGGGGAENYAEDEIIINTFWVEFDAVSGLNSLFCQGHFFNGAVVIGSSTQQAIASGVEAMHVLFGQAEEELPVTGEKNVARYTNSANIFNWNQVYSVRISFLTRSLTDVTNSVALRQYVLLDAEPYSLTDALSRQVFTTTFTINNPN